MAVGQQKLRRHELQHKSNTKMNLERFVVKNSRYRRPPKVFNGKAMGVPADLRQVRYRKLTETQSSKSNELDSPRKRRRRIVS